MKFIFPVLRVTQRWALHAVIKLQFFLHICSFSASKRPLRWNSLIFASLLSARVFASVYEILSELDNRRRSYDVI